MATFKRQPESTSLYARLDEVNMTSAARVSAKAHLRATESVVNGIADTLAAVRAWLAAGWYAGSRGGARRARAH